MVLFPSAKDIEFMTQKNKEVHTLFFNRYKLYIRDLDNQPYDPFYGETDEETFIWEHILVPAFVDFSIDKRDMLTKFGLDRERNLIVWCSNRILEELEIDPKPGDIFIIDNKEFEILEDNLEANVWNENLHLDRAIITELRKQSTHRDDRIEREDGVPAPDKHAFKDDVEDPPGFTPDDSYETTDVPFDPNFPEGPYDP